MRCILHTFIAWFAWPGLLAACIGSTALGFVVDQPQIGFVLTYAALMASLVLLERWAPHEPAWMPRDGVLSHDIGHTVLSTGAVQGLLVFGSVIGASAGLKAMSGPGFAVWPDQWPLALQVGARRVTVVGSAVTYASRRAARGTRPPLLRRGYASPIVAMARRPSCCVRRGAVRGVGTQRQVGPRGR